MYTMECLSLLVAYVKTPILDAKTLLSKSLDVLMTIKFSMTARDDVADLMTVAHFL